MANHQESTALRIYLRLNNGNGCSLNLQSSQQISQLAASLAHCDLQLPDNYRLVFKGHTLKDISSSLAQLGITNNSILHVESVDEGRTRPSKIDVCVYLKGEKFIVKTSGEETVYALKQSISKLTKIYPKDQILVFKGRKLKNQHLIEYYKIGVDSLICLHSTAKDTFSQLPSQFSQMDSCSKFILKETDLLESVLSLYDMKSEASKTTLFRSESLNKKNLEELIPYEVQIHQRAAIDEHFGEKEFNFDLFKSFGVDNPMKLSIGYNLFDSLKHPLYGIQHEESFSEDEIGERNDESSSLAESIQGYEE